MFFIKKNSFVSKWKQNEQLLHFIFRLKFCYFKIATPKADMGSNIGQKSSLSLYRSTIHSIQRVLALFHSLSSMKLINNLNRLQSIVSTLEGLLNNSLILIEIFEDNHKENIK